MPLRIDVIGQRFARVLVISNAPHVRGRRRVNCLCDCGTQFVCDPRLLRMGKTKSCGCFHRDQVSKSCSRRFTHSMTGTPEYLAWIHMKGRCYNESNRKFKDYGGRGIRVCDRWRESFEAFYEDMGKKPFSSASLDRIDVNGDYSPANCRWTSAKVQARNKRHHRIVQLKGDRMPLSQACEIVGVNYRSALHRLNSGKHWMPLPEPPEVE